MQSHPRDPNHWSVPITNILSTAGKKAGQNKIH